MLDNLVNSDEKELRKLKGIGARINNAGTPSSPNDSGNTGFLLNNIEVGGVAAAVNFIPKYLSVGQEINFGPLYGPSGANTDWKVDEALFVKGDVKSSNIKITSDDGITGAYLDDERFIKIANRTVDGPGNNLTLQAGGGKGANSQGGNLILKAGAGESYDGLAAYKNGTIFMNNMVTFGGVAPFGSTLPPLTPLEYNATGAGECYVEPSRSFQYITVAAGGKNRIDEIRSTYISTNAGTMLYLCVDSGSTSNVTVHSNSTITGLGRGIKLGAATRPLTKGENSGNSTTATGGSILQLMFVNGIWKEVSYIA